MGRRLRRSGSVAIAAALACAGCAAPDPQDRAGAGDTLTIAFETVATPAAFFREGPAIADPEGGASGFWAAVPRLPRPERALIVNPATGASVEAALFAGGATGTPIRLSGAVAEALGIGASPTPVRITALRREPRLVRP
jgi:hypothetical protein